MLKSLELKQSIFSLKNCINDAMKKGEDVMDKAQELEALTAEYEEAIKAEQKQKTIFKGDKKMSMTEKKQAFNRVLKNLLMGNAVAEADKEYMPKIVNEGGSGQYPSSDNKQLGSYLIPEEFMEAYALNEGIVNLAGYVDQVAVSAPSGKIPTVDYSQKIQLADFVNDNETEIAKKNAVFGQTPYNLGTRGAIIPISRELMQDSDSDVLGIINRLFARAEIETCNDDILACATETGVQTAQADMATVATIDKIKECLIAKLGISYRNNAKVVMNSNTFAVLANIKDEDGHPYIQPDITNPNRYLVMGKEIVEVENDDLADNVIVVGDLKQIRKIVRVGFEVQANESAGFETNSVKVRAIARFMCKNMYHNAFVKITKSAG